MYESSAPPQTLRFTAARRHVSVAREPRAAYASAPLVPARPTAAEALAQLDAAIAALGEVDWAAESDTEVNAAAVKLQRQVNAVSAQALRPLTAMQRRDSYRRDGAVTAASWLRNRANLDPAAAARLCTAARRLPQLGKLGAAFAAGDVAEPRHRDH